ncbi:hypothetical protein IAG41_21065 [Sphingomonas sp. JC676]|uniref:hypothetical protein n=1 Tax=Sphingomonas sp. JC676 TaxID=2768065 RepID=UPI001657E7F7|nr:hypothetical protein [Sphingomonas sp. JC676]MBC9034890.1 hypothetical protein [Sphingomonas sp. JC676]
MTVNRRVLIGSAGIALTMIAATTAGIAQNGNTVPEEYRYVDIGAIAGVTGQDGQLEKKCKPKGTPLERTILGNRAC